MYEQIIKESFAKFKGDESVMWASIKLVNDTLTQIKDENPSLYWNFMRNAHELMHGKHFDKAYAKWEVEQMHHTDADGKVYKGEHWSVEQATAIYDKHKNKLSQEITPYDFYVALNAQYHDYYCWAKAHLSTEEAIEIAIVDGAIRFWFLDEDWGYADKVWCYFRMKNK